MATSPPAAARSFTIRVPIPLYLDICSAAASEGVAINIKVNQLLNLGLGHHTDLNATLAKMLMRLLVEEEVQDVE